MGLTSIDLVPPIMPAHLHDWHYRLGREFALPRSYRKLADVEYRRGCVRVLRDHLGGPMLLAGIGRAWTRYYALRLFGGSAWRNITRPPL